MNDAPFVQMFQGSNQTSHVKGAGRTPRSIFQEDLIDQVTVDRPKSFNSENERMTNDNRKNKAMNEDGEIPYYIYIYYNNNGDSPDSHRGVRVRGLVVLVCLRKEWKKSSCFQYV